MSSLKAATNPLAAEATEAVKAADQLSNANDNKLQHDIGDDTVLVVDGNKTLISVHTKDYANPSKKEREPKNVMFISQFLHLMHKVKNCGTDEVIIMGDFNTQLLIKKLVGGTRFYFIDKDSAIPAGDDMTGYEYVEIIGFDCKSDAPLVSTSNKMRAIDTAQTEKTFIQVKAIIDYIINLVRNETEIIINCALYKDAYDKTVADALGAVVVDMGDLALNKHPHIKLTEEKDPLRKDCSERTSDPQFDLEDILFGVDQTPFFTQEGNKLSMMFRNGEGEPTEYATLQLLNETELAKNSKDLIPQFIKVANATDDLKNKRNALMGKINKGLETSNKSGGSLEKKLTGKYYKAESQIGGYRTFIGGYTLDAENPNKLLVANVFNYIDEVRNNTKDVNIKQFYSEWVSSIDGVSKVTIQEMISKAKYKHPNLKLFGIQEVPTERRKSDVHYGFKATDPGKKADKLTRGIILDMSAPSEAPSGAPSGEPVPTAETPTTYVYILDNDGKLKIKIDEESTTPATSIPDHAMVIYDDGKGSSYGTLNIKKDTAEQSLEFVTNIPLFVSFKSRINDIFKEHISGEKRIIGTIRTPDGIKKAKAEAEAEAEAAEAAEKAEELATPQTPPEAQAQTDTTAQAPAPEGGSKTKKKRAKYTRKSKSKSKSKRRRTKSRR